jgi:hypothetical protein
MLLYAHMGGLDLATLEPRSVPEYCIGPGTGAMDPEAYVGDGGSLPKELVRRQGIVVAYAAAYGQAVDKVSQWRDGREEHHREQRQRTNFLTTTSMMQGKRDLHKELRVGPKNPQK